ncbi:MAG: hypothetical protein JWR80_8285 [Bradyrhizobium sp.]|nr:hypothetical protein [Bradyrhizobium sp.]
MGDKLGLPIAPGRLTRLALTQHWLDRYAGMGG